MPMKFFLTCDVTWESKVDKVRAALSDHGYRQYFVDRDYGSGVSEVAVILLCQIPELALKPRLRFAKKTKVLSMDVMLDLPSLIGIEMDERQRIVASRMLEDIPRNVLKYKIEDFDSQRFVSDFKSWILTTGWLNAAMPPKTS